LPRAAAPGQTWGRGIYYTTPMKTEEIKQLTAEAATILDTLSAEFPKKEVSISISIMLDTAMLTTRLGSLDGIAEMIYSFRRTADEAIAEVMEKAEKRDPAKHIREQIENLQAQLATIEGA